jgi:hypothetical protein
MTQSQARRNILCGFLRPFVPLRFKVFKSIHKTFNTVGI